VILAFLAPLVASRSHRCTLPCPAFDKCCNPCGTPECVSVGATTAAEAAAATCPIAFCPLETPKPRRAQCGTRRCSLIKKCCDVCGHQRCVNVNATTAAEADAATCPIFHCPNLCGTTTCSRTKICCNICGNNECVKVNSTGAHGGDNCPIVNCPRQTQCGSAMCGPTESCCPNPSCLNAHCIATGTACADACQV